MEKLRRARGGLRGHFTRTAKELSDLLQAEPLNKVNVSGKLQQFQKVFEKLEGLDQQVLGLMLEVEVDQSALTDGDQVINSEYEDAAKYQSEFYSLCAQAEAALQPPLCVDQPPLNPIVDNRASASESGVRRELKLPKIELKKFSGELVDWLGWWAQFEKIHNDDTLADVDKFHYLAQSMQPGTKPSKLVDSYPMCAANYQKVVKALTERFGKKDMIADLYIRNLLNLVFSNVVHKKKSADELPEMYYKLETYLRSLESLGVGAKQGAMFLFPLMESSLPTETLKAWQRSSVMMGELESDEPQHTAEQKLDLLMKFLSREVQGAERIERVQAGLDSGKTQKTSDGYKAAGQKASEPTAAGLLGGVVQRKCVFCVEEHASRDCPKAILMSLADRKQIVQKFKLCFNCLIPGHPVKDCRNKMRCDFCHQKHSKLLCSSTDQEKQPEKDSMTPKEVDEPVHSASNVACSSKVLLKTLVVKVKGPKGLATARLLFDEGSQCSYITTQLVEKLGLKAKGEQWMQQVLFGGATSTGSQVKFYEVNLISLDDRFSINVTMFALKDLCGKLPSIPHGTWSDELMEHGIVLYDDMTSSSEIQIVIGSDFWGKCMTSKLQCLKSGLTAMESRFGWTISGPLGPNLFETNVCQVTYNSVLSMFVGQHTPVDFWDMELIGIKERELYDQKRTEQETWDLFMETVDRNAEGRYEVQLPWKVDKKWLSDNKDTAVRRLYNETRKLVASGLYEKYDTVIQEWVKEGYVQEDERFSGGHFLAHRPVIKESSSSTPVRPVFDASAGSPSLNNCLETGPNMLEQIPSLLIRFRTKAVGVTADVKKAFMQVVVKEQDQEYLKFLWWKDSDRTEYKVLRHVRVVFGITCSPFLLSAVIKVHLKEEEDSCPETIEILKSSLYVDNCVASLDSVAEYEQFQMEAQMILGNACMDLRQWHYSGCESQETLVGILGLEWNTATDQMRVKLDLPPLSDKITKRTVLSALQRVYDPLGMYAPVTLVAKLIMQNAWRAKQEWDADLSEDMKAEYMKWWSQWANVEALWFPRWLLDEQMEESKWYMHVFCDASPYAYATVIYLKVVSFEKIHLRMLTCKTRVAPVKTVTIPRLELMACIVGVRLAKFVQEALNVPLSGIQYWTDSMVSLAWIQRDTSWGTFVSNRVREIRQLSDTTRWRYVSSAQNPADLASRGCSLEELKDQRWWEGPNWLIDENLTEKDFVPESDEQEIAKEQKRNSIATNVAAVDDTKWWDRHMKRTYWKNVRCVAWMLRFLNNVRKKTVMKGNCLSGEELEEAERALWKVTQRSTLPDVDSDSCVLGVKVVQDSYGLMRVRTKLWEPSAAEEFQRPVLLVAEHPLVTQLIEHVHEKSCHAGIQITRMKLREKFWIVGGKKVRKVIKKCWRCQRYQAKPCETEPCALPEDRTSLGLVFQVTGIDLAGPLCLKNGDKSWIVLFTCSVYRCIHLELVSSASTDSFLLALTRFVSRRGRPSTIYTDNGTNFVGADNLFAQIDWERVQNDENLHPICWKFNPPAAPWWGGWWERMIRMVKELLRKTLGKRRLNFEELSTVLCQVEEVINSRPLTYQTEQTEEWVPLTPANFLRDINCGKLVELELVDASELREQSRKVQGVLSEFKARFRKEYQAALVQRKGRKSSDVHVGDIVLVSMENCKKLEWPLARVLELFKGRDGYSRVARIKTAHGILVRPLKRLYLLEFDEPNRSSFQERTDNDHELPAEKSKPDQNEVSIGRTEIEQYTRRGRQVRPPQKLSL